MSVGTVGVTALRRRIAFAVVLLAVSMPPLNFFIVNVALPAIHTHLGASDAEVQLVIAGYTAAFALMLITAGRLGDLFGRRRLFMIGMTAFTLTSVLCGVAPSGEVLVFGRILQGISAALFAPQLLGSIRALYGDHELVWALDIYSTVIGVAVAGGQLLGGVLVAADLWGLGWRSGFLINLPLGVIVLVAAAFLLPETGGQSRPRFDWGGVILLSVALAAMIVPLTIGRAHGWPVELLLMLASSPFLVALFLAFEKRMSAAGGLPILDPALISLPGFRRGIWVALLFFFTTPFYLLFSIYQQAGLGLDVLVSGLSILPYGVGSVVGPLLATSWSEPCKSHQFAIGMGIQIAGYAAIGSAVYFLIGGWPLLTILFIAGFGQGIAMPRMISAVIAEASTHQASLAAGILNSVLQIGSAISVSAVGSLFFAVLGGGGGPFAYARAFAIAMAATTWCLLVSMALGLRRGRG